MGRPQIGVLSLIVVVRTPKLSMLPPFPNRPKTIHVTCLSPTCLFWALFSERGCVGVRGAGSLGVPVCAALTPYGPCRGCDEIKELKLMPGHGRRTLGLQEYINTTYFGA